MEDFLEAMQQLLSLEEAIPKKLSGEDVCNRILSLPSLLPDL